MSPATYTCLTLNDAVGLGYVQDADLALFRGRGTVAAGIQIKGRSEYSHAGMVAINRGIPMLGESREWYGARLVTLQSQVRKYQGQIDIYTANAGERWCEFDRDGAAKYMMQLAGNPYAYRLVLKAALRRKLLYRLFVRDSGEAIEWRREALNMGAKKEFDQPVYCSMACDLAYQFGGGVDVVPRLTSRLTEPGDLSRSPFFAYSCTLI